VPCGAQAKRKISLTQLRADLLSTPHSAYFRPTLGAHPPISRTCHPECPSVWRAGPFAFREWDHRFECPLAKFVILSAVLPACGRHARRISPTASCRSGLFRRGGFQPREIRPHTGFQLLKQLSTSSVRRRTESGTILSSATPALFRANILDTGSRSHQATEEPGENWHTNSCLLGSSSSVHCIERSG
jgi:hypothetical protein